MRFKRFEHPCSAIAFLAILSVGAHAQGISNPLPLLTDGDRTRSGGLTEEAPATTSRSVSRETDPGARLELRLKKGQVHNPARGGMDNVWLRGYVDMEREERRRQGLEPAAVGPEITVPVIEAVPGQTTRIDIYNHMLPWAGLPEDVRVGLTDSGMTEAVYSRLMPADECDHAAHGPESINIPNAHPGCFNTSNNHFHGGWVNPSGNSDNVLRMLHPAAGVAHEYEYNISADHPAGTFWYHPHVHGSTALQLASGMAGALIVKGDRWPEPASSGFRAGDIDMVLRKADGSPIPDRLFLLQQIQYKCFNSDGAPKEDLWNCAAEDIGAIVDYGNMGGPNWNNSGRFTTVNGHVADVIGVGDDDADRVIAGQPERWRFVHAGFADTIKVQIFPAVAGEAPEEPVDEAFRNATAEETDAVIARTCNIGGPASDDVALEVFEIAADGLTRTQAFGAKSRTLQPGYRSDLLVTFPQPPDEQAVQEYCVVAMPLTANESVEGSVDRKRLLFTVKVQRSEAAVPDAKTAIRNMMVIAATLSAGEQAKKGADISLLPAILGDLFNDLTLTHFSPHDTLMGNTVVQDEEHWTHIDNIRMLRFNRTGSAQAGSETAAAAEGIGHHRLSRSAYEEAAGDDAMTGLVPAALLAGFGDLRFSDRADELIALQLNDIDEWRLSVAEGGAQGAHPFHIHVNPFQVARVTRVADGADLTQDVASQYYGMKGVYKDTIMVEPGAEIVVRSHYERYVGRFVLHCHILPHEDAGMMRLVEIFEPVTPGGLDRIEERAREQTRLMDLALQAGAAAGPEHAGH